MKKIFQRTAQTVTILNPFEAIISRLPNDLKAFTNDDFNAVSKKMSDIYGYYCFDAGTSNPVLNTYCCLVVKRNINNKNKLFNPQMWLKYSIAERAMRQDIARLILERLDGVSHNQNFLE